MSSLPAVAYGVTRPAYPQLPAYRHLAIRLESIDMTKVLVVDDDPDVRALLNVWLRGAEFQMITAEDGYQAVQFARQQQPDVILLDVNLPAGKGFVVHERLKGISNVANVPIIYISSDRSAAPKALAAGAARFLAKPLNKDSVLGALREVCPTS